MHYLATIENAGQREDCIIAMARRLGFLLTCKLRYTVKSVGPSYIHVNSIFTVVGTV
jgi:hypothetical protein